MSNGLLPKILGLDFYVFFRFLGTYTDYFVTLEQFRFGANWLWHNLQKCSKSCIDFYLSMCGTVSYSQCDQ